MQPIPCACPVVIRRIILLLAVLAPVSLFAQAPGSGGPAGVGSRQSGPMGPGTSLIPPLSTRSPETSPSASSAAVSSGPRFGPAGRWWNDRQLSKALHLRPDQQARMDLVFVANKPSLSARYHDLLGEESRMDRLCHQKVLEEQAIFAQIDRVTLARGEYEKVKAHYLLQIRKEMDPDQIARMEADR